MKTLLDQKHAIESSKLPVTICPVYMSDELTAEKFDLQLNGSASICHFTLHRDPAWFMKSALKTSCGQKFGIYANKNVYTSDNLELRNHYGQC